MNVSFDNLTNDINSTILSALREPGLGPTDGIYLFCIDRCKCIQSSN